VQFSTDTEPQYWFEVQKDNTILFHSPKIEMGQGVFSALAQIVAEELEVSVNQIKVVHSATSHGIDPNTTGGSDSISSTFSQLSMLAASMREMLRERAVTLLGISLSNLSAQNGYVIGQGKKLSYAQIVAQTSEWSLPDTEPTLKKPEKYQVIGKALPRVDLVAKVKAEPIFGIDATFPGMVYAAVVRSPYFGAVRGVVNAQEASKSLGVIRVVEQPEFVAVLAKSRYEALMAKEKLQIAWTSPTPLLQQKK
jgi:isoquinoline 1-oxidoreductase beta subunit